MKHMRELNGLKYLKRFNESKNEITIDDLNIVRSLFSEMSDEFDLNEVEYVPGQSSNMEVVLRINDYQLHIDPWDCISIYGVTSLFKNDPKKVQFYWSRFISSLNSNGYKIWKDMPNLGDKIVINHGRIYFGTNLIYNE